VRFLCGWAGLLALGGCLAASTAGADEIDPWRRGCPNCTVIPVPAGMAGDLAAFAQARRRQARPAALVGPACRRLGPSHGNAEICILETGTGCGNVELVAMDGTVAVIRFAGYLSGPARCRRADLARFRAAVLAAFLRCPSGRQKREAIRRLVLNPVDTTTPAGTARFDREAAANAATGAAPSFDIQPVCGSTAGHRSIAREQDGLMERISLTRPPP
jgi:hypothetical protein